MTIKLHRCRLQWLKTSGSPCWRVERALIEQGIEYVRVAGPHRPSRRTVVLAGTGQRLYPAIEFEDGSWYREESAEMARRIREGQLHTGS